MNDIPKKKSVVIYGAGNQAKVVIEALMYSDIVIKGLLADHMPAGLMVHGYPVLGGFEMDFPMDADYYHFAFGNVSDRSAVQDYLDFPSRASALAVIHPSATVSSSAFICPGAFIGPQAVVHSRAMVHEFAMVNTGAILEHDCVLGKFSHLAPGAVTGGHVDIGERTMIGIGAMIRDHITIGRGVTVGMGAVVTKKVDDYTTVYGNPARVIPCA